MLLKGQLKATATKMWVIIAMKV